MQCIYTSIIHVMARGKFASVGPIFTKKPFNSLTISFRLIIVLPWWITLSFAFIYIFSINRLLYDRPWMCKLPNNFEIFLDNDSLKHFWESILILPNISIILFLFQQCDIFWLSCKILFWLIDFRKVPEIQGILFSSGFSKVCFGIHLS